MSDRVEEFRAAIAKLQKEFDRELAETRKALAYQLIGKRVVFEHEMRRRHRAARVKLSAFLAATRPMVLVTAPVIYALIFPFVLLDLFVSIYQTVCFPVYGIAKVKRADHIAFDHRHLAYLNGLQKLNCLYCSYCNGLISYVREIAARTEQYWCPIKHARTIAGPHDRYPAFTDYGDAEAFRSRTRGLRQALKKPQT
jgi:hypothetical protein